MRVLDARTLIVREEIALTTHAGQGYRMIMRGAAHIADESDETHSRVARYALSAGSLAGKSVAWIGGGLCVGPRLFSLTGCVQTVFELEPRLVEFCPSDVRFIAGDYVETLNGKYDVIVYDLPGEVPRAFLAPFLNRNGVVIP